MLVMLLLVAADLPWQPASFPELPEGFGQWQRHHRILREDRAYERTCFWRTHNQGPMEDTTHLPYTIDIPGYSVINIRGSTAFGKKNYYDPEVEVTRPYNYNRVSVRWFAHSELNPDSIRFFLLADPDMRLPPCDMAFAEEGVEEITIGESNAYRIRCKWWHCSARGAYQRFGSLTLYLITTPTLDFHITCFTTSFDYVESRLEDPLGGPLRRAERNYPDPIAELEQAVEESFKIKEGT